MERKGGDRQQQQAQVIIRILMLKVVAIDGDSSRRDRSDNSLSSHVQIGQPMTTPLVDRSAPLCYPTVRGVSSQEENFILHRVNPLKPSSREVVELLRHH